MLIFVDGVESIGLLFLIDGLHLVLFLLLLLLVSVDASDEESVAVIF